MQASVLRNRKTVSILAALRALVIMGLVAGSAASSAETINRALKGDRLPVHQPERFGGHIEDWDTDARPNFDRSERASGSGSERASGFQEAAPRRHIDPAPAQLRGQCQGMSAVVCDVFAATNRERSRNGLPLFKIDQACQKAANDHARDMAQRGFFSHNSPDGRTMADRYERYGRWTTLGENIAMGTHMDGPGAVNSWMNSPGHRRNILNRDFGSMGVGVVEGRGYRYFVQCFSR